MIDVLEKIIFSVCISIVSSIILIYIFRRIVGVPYPDECVFHNPDTKGAIESLTLVEDDTDLKWVMGTLNSKIFGEPDVDFAFRNFLRRGIPTEIIIGPHIDPDSKELLKELIESDHITIRMMDKNPEKHFKIISGKHIFIEPKNHPEGRWSAYLLLKNVKSLVKGYNRIFSNYKRESKLINQEKQAYPL